MGLHHNTNHHQQHQRSRPLRVLNNVEAAVTVHGVGSGAAGGAPSTVADPMPAHAYQPWPAKPPSPPQASLAPQRSSGFSSPPSPGPSFSSQVGPPDAFSSMHERPSRILGDRLKLPIPMPPPLPVHPPVFDMKAREWMEHATKKKLAENGGKPLTFRQQRELETQGMIDLGIDVPMPSRAQVLADRGSPTGGYQVLYTIPSDLANARTNEEDDDDDDEEEEDVDNPEAASTGVSRLGLKSSSATKFVVADDDDNDNQASSPGPTTLHSGP